MLYILKIPPQFNYFCVVVVKTDRRKKMLDSWDEIIEDEDEVFED